jgi:sulfate adenylyltransferase subunit 2
VSKERFFHIVMIWGNGIQNQRPELWNIFNGKHFEGEHLQASN